jgi:hypothetical protein
MSESCGELIISAEDLARIQAANVRRFFQAEEPIVSPRRSESAQDRLEREARASFGGWDVMNMLLRAAPPSPGAPTPNEDQSHCSLGVQDCPRSMPAWRREFHREVGNEQQLRYPAAYPNRRLPEAVMCSIAHFCR